MRVTPPPPSSQSPSATAKDAELLFRTKPIAEIRNVESETRKQIQQKSEELRQLVGNRYRDLIDSADSIVLMKSSCTQISNNISSIHSSILHSLTPNQLITNRSTNYSSNSSNLSVNSSNLSRSMIYAIATRVKYLVDTPENIWGCLDECMYLDAAARYMRAKFVNQSLVKGGNVDVLKNFPLLQHQWQIVESFTAQISQRSRERLLDQSLGLRMMDYADALAAVAVVDEMDPREVLSLFLASRRSCISQKLSACGNVSEEVISVFCEVLKMIQISVAQVGELFLQVLSDMPLFYKTVLGSPPASQLFGGIMNPDEEVSLWTSFRDRLESVMVMLDKSFIANACSDWLRSCGKEIVSKVNGRYLIDVIDSGQQLAAAEKLIRETMEGKQVLEGSLEWLKSVFGSEIELPWSRTRELVLGDEADLWDEIFEEAFTSRMKSIIGSGFDELSNAVNVKESIHAVVDAPSDRIDFQAYLKRSSSSGGVWFAERTGKASNTFAGPKIHIEENDFQTCLNAYFGDEVGRIRVAVDSRCENVLEDLFSFLESPKASSRLKILVPFIQNKCFGSMSTILMELKNELEQLYAVLDNNSRESDSIPSHSILVERALFIGRLLFAFQKYSKHIPVILGSPRSWVNGTIVPGTSAPFSRYSRMAADSPTAESPGKKMLDSSKRQTSIVASALFGANDSSSPQLEELSRTTSDLCVRAHNLWISWVTDELSSTLSRDLRRDDFLSATTPFRGWEETVVKQEESSESQTEMKISLPSMPSLYISSYLFQACEEIHRVGGHVLDKPILQNFASRLFQKVVEIYANFLSTEASQHAQVSEKGVLQLLFDLRFAADVLAGSDVFGHDYSSKTQKVKSPFRRKQDVQQTKSVIQVRFEELINQLSNKLDPIDWLTYEPYLWENERQSYLRHAVLFGFFVQLHRMYTNTVQKLPTNSESNIMRCSVVPRFKYLPISAPALSTKGTSKTSITTTMDDMGRSSWRSYTQEELSRSMDNDDSSSFGVATPLLKSFMQVGSRFGESTLKLGSMLTDGQVGRFGDILPAQAAGLLSSFTAGRSEY